MRALASVLVLAGIASCSGSAPSRVPLAPAPEPTPHTPKNSSRASPADDSATLEERPSEIEVQVDDDDDSEGRVSSSTAPTKTCAFKATERPGCSRLASAGKGVCAGSIAQRACETWGPHLDARVGDRWLACLSESRTASACTGSETLRCATLAVSTSCIDGSYRARCQRIAEACSDTLPELTPSLCEHAVAAFSPVKRAQIVDCFEHGCETGAFGSCIP